MTFPRSSKIYCILIYQLHRLCKERSAERVESRAGSAATAWRRDGPIRRAAIAESPRSRRPRAIVWRGGARYAAARDGPTRRAMVIPARARLRSTRWRLAPHRPPAPKATADCRNSRRFACSRRSRSRNCSRSCLNLCSRTRSRSAGDRAAEAAAPSPASRRRRSRPSNCLRSRRLDPSPPANWRGTTSNPTRAVRAGSSSSTMSTKPSWRKSSNPSTRRRSWRTSNCSTSARSPGIAARFRAESASR